MAYQEAHPITFSHLMFAASVLLYRCALILALIPFLLVTGCQVERNERAAPQPVQTTGDDDRSPLGPELSQTAIQAYADSLRLPLSGEADGLAIFYAQVLLNRAGFSPGEIDGAWGDNLEKAVYWLQSREEIEPTGTLDEATLRRLVRLAAAPDNPNDLIVEHTITEEEASGPFTEIPEDIYEQAEMDRLNYESLAEKLGEQFHSNPDMLERLNDGQSINEMSAGDVIRVPDVLRGTAPGRGAVARLVVSDGGGYLHALDEDGTIAYHFPATLGSEYDPSPNETLEIVSVTKDPWWHYQPGILEHVDDDEEDARIPPGPNNAVGSVWIALSREHYGIHGTADPDRIGYATSAGCVRLTNWDALFLADRVSSGVEVEFRDVGGGEA